MWSLSFEYEDDKGQSHTEYAILRQNVEYSIGRSVGCNFRIQNDKSVSRVHLMLSFEGNEISIKNKGKLTKFSHKTLQVDENVVIHNEDAVISIGGTPIDVRLQYSYQQWKVPHKINIEETKAILSQYDIKLSDSFSKKTTLQIYSDASNHTGCLFALLKGVSVVSTDFLTDVSQLLQAGNHVDANNAFEKLIEKYDKFPHHTYMQNTLSGITIIVFDQKIFDTLRYTIEVGGGNLKLLSSAEDVAEFLASYSTPIIALSTDSFDPLISTVTKYDDVSKSIMTLLHQFGIKVHSINQLVTGILDSKLSSISQNVDHIDSNLAAKQQLSKDRKEQRKITAGSSLLPAKKARTKPKVESLDSLSYFGGGQSANQVPKTPRKHVDKITIGNKTPLADTHRSASDIPKMDDALQSVLLSAETDKNKEEVDLAKIPKQKTALLSRTVDKSQVMPIKREPSQITANQRKKRPRIQQLNNLMMRSASKIKPGSSDAECQSASELVELCADVNVALEQSKEPSPPTQSQLFDNVTAKKQDQQNQEQHSDQNVTADATESYLSHQRPNKFIMGHPPSLKDAALSNLLGGEKVGHDLSNVDNCRPVSVANLNTGLPTEKKSFNLAHAIADTKEKEIKRYEEGIVEVMESELTEDALQEFKDVAQVNKVDFSHRVLNPQAVSTDNNSITGRRKNYKRFVKHWPSYLNLKQTCQNDLPETKRKYIRLESYDKKRAAVQLHSRENISSERLDDFGTHKVDKTAMSLPEEEEDNSSSFQFSARKVPIEGKPLFVSDDGEESQGRIVHNSSPNSQVEKDVEVATGSNYKSGTTHTSRTSTMRIKAAEEEYDDDDDDDTPRFNFRSRRQK